MPGGFTVPTRSCVVETGGGTLAVLSPLPDEDARRDVSALGRVAFLVAPNSFHYVGLPSWEKAFPAARSFLAPALRARRPELVGEELVEGTPTPFGDVLAHAVLGPQRGVSEVAFLHRPSRTLILTDAAFHIRAARPRDRVFWRVMGVWRRFGPSLTARTVLLRNRADMRDWIERLCRLEFARIEVAHGEALEDASADTLRAAFRAYL